MWVLALSSALAQTSPYFNVDCSPVGPLAFGEPTEVTCSVTPEIFSGEPITSWTSATWLMGDGTVFEGDDIAHTYTEQGAFTITVRLDGLVRDRGDGPVEIPGTRSVTRLGDYFTLCGPPEPEFELIDKGGLRYDVVNTSAVDQARCLRELEYTVRREGANRVIVSTETWEPSFELPDEDTYVVSLTMSGLGGESAYDLVLDAEYNLTSDYYRSFAQPCSTAPVGSALGLLAMVALAAGRRRRR